MRFSQDARQRAAGTGKVTFTVYDAFGRVTRVGEATATFSSLDPESSYPFERDATSWRSRMTYDDGDAVAGGGPNSRASGPNYAQGRLVKVEENTDSAAAAEVVHEYAYDHLGSVRVKQVTIDGLIADKTVEYVHDLAGRVTRLIYPDGSQARYAYDGAGRLTRVWDEQGKTLAAYTHTAAGNIATHIVGATHTVGDDAGEGIVTGAYAYNAREWVTRIDYPGRFFISQQYDAVGNVSSQNYRRAASESEKAASYTYDNLHRLTGFNLDSGSSTQSYEYDRNGNITQITADGAAIHHSYSRSTTPNRLDAIFGASPYTQFAYNANGWTTSVGDVPVTYDYRGLTTGHGSARYLMDPDRRRVKKTAGTAVTYYVRGADGTVLAEYDGQALSARYVYAGSRRIARVEGDSASYYLADHLGSTRSLVDDSGTVTAAYDYWPYGKVLATSGAESTHFRFTGHERDSESGLDYMLARSYAYDIGRFLRPDPMQDEYPGISPYAYANNNPLKYVDPDGRAAETIWDVVNIGIGAASLAQNIREGSYGWAALDAVGLVVDVAATITPGVPGGAGTLIKVLRGARSADRGADAADTAGSAIHGNSKLSTKPQHRYEIYNTETGDVVKTGISGRPLNVDGTSPRAKTQVNAFNRQEGAGTYSARIVETDVPGRQAALKAEQDATNRLHHEGHALHRQKRPQPQQ